MVGFFIPNILVISSFQTFQTTLGGDNCFEIPIEVLEHISLSRP
jgi:hypothetical protein